MAKVNAGPRSIMAREYIGNNFIQYQKEQFEILSQTIDFVSKSSGFASIGLNKDREVILVSEQDKTTIIAAWNKYFSEQQKLFPKTLNAEEEFGLYLFHVNVFTREHLYKQDEKTLAEIIANQKSRGNKIYLPNESSSRAAISISYFLHRQYGVCRHHSIINGIILAHLINTMTFMGEVRQYRDVVTDDTKNERTGAHTVTCLIRPSGELWIFDSLNYPVPFPIDPTQKFIEGKYKTAQNFRQTFGIEFYSRILTLIPAKKPVMPPKKPRKDNNPRENINPLFNAFKHEHFNNFNPNIHAKQDKEINNLFKQNNFQENDFDKFLNKEYLNIEIIPSSETILKIQMKLFVLLGKFVTQSEEMLAKLDKFNKEAHAKISEDINKPHQESLADFSNTIKEAAAIIVNSETSEASRKAIQVELIQYTQLKNKINILIDALKLISEEDLNKIKAKDISNSERAHFEKGLETVNKLKNKPKNTHNYKF